MAGTEPRVTANVEAQIRLRYAAAVANTEAYRLRWSTAVPTEKRSSALGRLVRQWQAEADAWKAVLDMVVADRVYDRLGDCKHISWESFGDGRPWKCTDCDHCFTTDEQEARR